MFWARGWVLANGGLMRVAENILAGACATVLRREVGGVYQGRALVDVTAEGGSGHGARG